MESLHSPCRSHWRRFSSVRRWRSRRPLDRHCSRRWGWCCNSWTWWRAPESCPRTRRCPPPWRGRRACSPVGGKRDARPFTCCRVALVTNWCSSIWDLFHLVHSSLWKPGAYITHAAQHLTVGLVVQCCCAWSSLGLLAWSTDEQPVVFSWLKWRHFMQLPSGATGGFMEPFSRMVSAFKMICSAIVDLFYSTACWLQAFCMLIAQNSTRVTEEVKQTSHNTYQVTLREVVNARH